MAGNLVAALFLLLALTGTSAGEAPAAKGPTSWYFSAMEHDGDAPSSGEHHHRSWEPEHAVDPATIVGYQRMYEMTRYPNGEQPTALQRHRADDLVRRCRDSAKRHRWFDFAQATRDGFVPMYSDDTHYVNEANALDDGLLDPDRPEFLLFYDYGGKKRLAAFMFLTRKPEERGPQLGGPLTVWHYHLWAKRKCLLNRLFVVGDPDATGGCSRGELAQRSPEMLHVWFVDRPEGPFATDMSLPADTRKQLELVKWE